MPLDFPNSPTTGQIHVSGVKSWTYDGEKWILTNQGMLGLYGAFSDYTTQTVASTTTAYPITLNTTDESNGVSIGTPTSRVVFPSAGTYNFQWSGQFRNTDNGDHDVQVWLRKNGTDVVGSTGLVSIPGSHAGQDGHTIAGWNYVLTLATNDYLELVWQSDSTSVTIATYAGGTSPTTPSTASMVVTATQVMKPQVGPQGPQGATGSTGATGPTGVTGQGVPVGGTAGQMLIKVSGTNYDNAWSSALNYKLNPKNNTNLYLRAPFSANTQAISAGTRTWHPIIVPRGGLTFDCLIVNCTVAAVSSIVRLGIYNDDGTGYPGSLVVDAGTVDTSTTGEKLATLSPTQTLSMGMYWACALTTGGSPTLSTIDHTTQGFMVPPVPQLSFSPGSVFRQGFAEGSISAGALPTDAPTNMVWSRFLVYCQLRYQP